MERDTAVSIDLLAPQASHIDLANRNLPSDFGLSDEYMLSKVLDDVLLVEYIDIVDDGVGGQALSRGGIVIPLGHVVSAWRKAKVVLAGPRVKEAKVGDIVLFPCNMGIGVTNIHVKGHGKIKDGYFINEQRMFGVCELNDQV